MHSRLYRNVLNQYNWMHNCTAFNSLYNDTGVVGIFATCEASKAENATDVITKELQVWAAAASALRPCMRDLCRRCARIHGI